ncbi:Hypothetical protein A7982_03871 [Minicystis rosea]|nr:Hypothetical protein A7982_03871 [Minicystis rosea]
MSTKRPKPPSGDPSLEAILRLAQEVPRDQVAADFDDPELQALIERTLASYIGVLTPKALERARATLALVFTTHPHAVAMLERQRRQPPAGGSGVVVKRGAESLAEAAEELRRAGNRRTKR